MLLRYSKTCIRLHAPCLGAAPRSTAGGKSRFGSLTVADGKTLGKDRPGVNIAAPHRLSGIVDYESRRYHGLMQVRVFSSSRPAVPGRALALSALLLAGVCVLAGTMTWQRTGYALAGRVHPPGWDISFKPPSGFMPGELATKEFGVALPFYARISSTGGAELVVWQVPSRSAKAIDIGRIVLREYSAWPLLSLLEPPPISSSVMLGALEAVELRRPNSGSPRIVVRTARLEHRGLSYSISLAVSGGAIDSELYRAFDLMCRSVRIESP